MLSAKQIEEISDQIKSGDAPDAIISLLTAYMERERMAPAETGTAAHYLWDLFKDSPKAVVRINEDNRILDVNDAFVTLCKVSRAEIFGRSIHSVINVQEELALSEQPLNEARGAMYEEFTVTCARADGKSLFLRIERFPDIMQKETYLLITDVTEQRRFSETLAQDSVRGEIFVDIVNSLWQDFMNYEKTLDVLTNKVSQHIGGSCIIHLLMDETDIIEHVAINHSNPKAMALFQDLLYSTRWHAGAGLPLEVVTAGNALLVPNVTKENLAMLGNNAFADCIATLQTRSLLMLPMYHNERIIGTITLLRTGTNQPYTNKDKSFIQRIANVGAMALINAQRMRKFNSELLTKLRSARSEVRHLRVLEAVMFAIELLQDPDTDLATFDTIVRLLCDAFDAESAFLALAGRAPGMFTIVSDWSSGEFGPALKTKFDGDIFLPSLWTTPLESGVILHRTMDNFTEAEKNFLSDADLLSVAIVPVVDHGKLKALLVFENCSSNEECMEQNERIIKTFMNTAKPAILALQPRPATNPDGR